MTFKSRSIRPLLLCALSAMLAGCSANFSSVFPKGYFQLTSQLGLAQNECLQSTNQTADIGAKMMPCENVPSQLWIARRTLDGHYFLQTASHVQVKWCLESTSHAEGSVLIDPCGNFTGQAWLAKSLDETRFKLTTQLRNPAQECLESGQAGDATGAHMDPCQDTPGQKWLIKWVEATA